MSVTPSCTSPISWKRLVTRPTLIQTAIATALLVVKVVVMTATANQVPSSKARPRAFLIVWIRQQIPVAVRRRSGMIVAVIVVAVVGAIVVDATRTVTASSQYLIILRRLIIPKLSELSSPQTTLQLSALMVLNLARELPERTAAVAGVVVVAAVVAAARASETSLPS